MKIDGLELQHVQYLPRELAPGGGCSAADATLPLAEAMAKRALPAPRSPL